MFNSENLLDFIKESSSYLHKCGITNAKQEIIWFCQFSFKFKLLDIKSNMVILSKKNIQELNYFINRRSKHEPFQYIISSAPFFKNNFFVDSSVLIPRPETETIINILKNKFFLNALDVGTGSGNIAITLKLENIAEYIDAIDNSKRALTLAKKNAKKMNANRINFQHINVFEYTFDKKYDLIVSNPPYIAMNDYDKLPENILNYEPKNALTDFKDGYSFYNFFSENLHLLLNPKGKMVLEIGLEKMKNKIDKLFFHQADIIWHKDLNGDYRIVELNV